MNTEKYSQIVLLSVGDDLDAGEGAAAVGADAAEAVEDVSPAKAFLWVTFFFRALLILDIIKFVSHSSQGNDQITVRTKTVAKHFDMCVNSAVVTIEVKAPYFFQKLLS